MGRRGLVLGRVQSLGGRGQDRVGWAWLRVGAWSELWVGGACGRGGAEGRPGQGRGREGSGLTGCRVRAEGVVDQREVQHGGGFGAVGILEQVALPGLPQLLGSWLHRGKGDALLLAEPAEELQLLRGRPEILTSGRAARRDPGRAWTLRAGPGQPAEKPLREGLSLNLSLNAEGPGGAVQRR